MASCSTKKDCIDVLNKFRGGIINVNNIYEDEEHDGKSFPFKFASRLNSMKDRQDLFNWDNFEDINTVEGWIRRQGHIKGLDYVDFNFPQHIKSREVDYLELNQLRSALNKAKLKCGAICLRFPKDMQAGAFTNPDEEKRREAIELTKQACKWAKALDTNEVVIWSAYCGYDYCLQVDYHRVWDDIKSAIVEVCDEYPDIKVSLEYKPTDENTRYFAIPSTGAAMLLVNEVNRKNFGLTLDFGHCLMAGENPAQALALVSRYSDKLFGIQLGDGYQRLGAEDGLVFGSVHPMASLEFVMWLLKTNYKGHIYFDTFPRNEDPLRECEYNIRKFKKFFKFAKQLLFQKEGKVDISLLQKNHDAMGILELLEEFI